ncbi:hypothetical protein [Massilia sp. LC238]|uniref:hypothetical protein n=1 Tax=Massilia sp. LC238 TaxID=1502852 RepID=UPI0004E3A6FD|nr:hypothetical protein [Massilia sp. LC238]KFC61966.1 hypothetical protein FG94_05006 [Massilia sp. LC238]
MFIKRQQHPSIEQIPEEGQLEPHLVHYFSDRGDPFKSVLPLLIEGAEQEEERVFMVESPLSEVVDFTIQLNRHQDFPDRPVMDEKHRAFFDAVKRALLEAAAKVDQIEYARLDEPDEDG